MATSSSTLSNNVAIYYEKKLLTRLIPLLHMYNFGKKGREYKPIPGAMGKTVVWTRFTNLPAATTALTEGDTPAGRNLSSARVSDTVKQYGDFTLITDFISLIAIDPLVEDASELFGEQAALTLDTLIHYALSGGTEQLANGKSALSDLAVSDTLDTAEIRKAVRTLEVNKARPHRVTPGFFPFFCHPYSKYDLIGDTATGGWIDTRKYLESKKKEIEMNKIGDLYGAKGFMTQNLHTVSSTVNTFNNLMISEESFGIVDIMGDRAKSQRPWIIVKQPGESGSADPLNQRGSVGWKVNFLTKLLDAARVIVMKTGATDQS